jgi:hypothetical protein
MSGLRPYGPASGTDIGDLYVETDEDQLFLSGSLSLPNDPASLPDLRRLIAILVEAERSLAAPIDGSEPTG